jgi:RHS repeat-associated protein
MVATNKILLPECADEGCGGETGTCTDSRVHRRNAENRAPATRNHRHAQPLARNLYQGMTLDAMTELYYGRARDYSPSLGRWMGQDPAQFINGANTYQFVKSSPVGNVDAEGLATEASPVGWTPSQLSLAARGRDLAAEGIRAYIKGHEGLRLTAYHGPKHGNLTIGYGHNLATPQGKANLLKVLKADGRAEFYDAILRGKCEITKTEADRLFNIDLAIARGQAKHDFSNFAQVPAEVQKALLDTEFNMGSLTDWRHLRHAVDRDNWHQAGIQILKSAYASQLPGRADDNAALVFDWALITRQANQAVEYIMGMSNQWP